LIVIGFVVDVSIAMDNTSIQSLLLQAVENKLPRKQNLANFLTEVLDIEKEAAYRRIRGSVPFSLKEAAILASAMNLSLDDVIANSLGEEEKRSTLLMHLPQHYQMGLQEPWHVEQDAVFLDELTREPYSEMGVALAGISSSLHYYYSHLARFYLMKYRYNLGERFSFEEIVESPEQIKYRDVFYCHYRNMSNTFYIWDRRIMQSLVDDIKYFQSLQMMTDKDVMALKKELHGFLDDLKLLADKGYYPDTRNKFELYVSDSYIDMTYAYMWTEKRYVSMYTSFVILTTSSEEEKPFKNVSDWVKSLRRGAIQISVVNERERILFFRQQHEIVNTLD